jgi:outer membrane biosynthesis protein TonB
VAATNEKTDSVRFNRSETRRLTRALILSLLLHLLGWGGYELGKKTGLWNRWHWPSHQRLAAKKLAPPRAESEPQIFLDVDPDQETPEAPKDAKYYSAKNSRAADAQAEKNSNQPQLNGKQKDVPKVRDAPRTPSVKPQPTPPAPQPQKQAEPAQPKPVEQAGDTKLAKTDVSPDKTETKPERPRTLKEAYAQQPSLKPSRAMQQDGGTLRHTLVPAFDSKATPFGAYDAQMFDAIQQYWDNELYSQNFSQDRTGRVTLQFHLNADGTVTDMKVLSNDVGDVLGYVCLQAVEVPAPFAKWPSDMRRMVGDNYRQITMTFIYY